MKTSLLSALYSTVMIPTANAKNRAISKSNQSSKYQADKKKFGKEVKISRNDTDIHTN